MLPPGTYTSSAVGEEDVETAIDAYGTVPEFQVPNSHMPIMDNLLETHLGQDNPNPLRHARMPSWKLKKVELTHGLQNSLFDATSVVAKPRLLH